MKSIYDKLAEALQTMKPATNSSNLQEMERRRREEQQMRMQRNQMAQNLDLDNKLIKNPYEDLSKNLAGNISKLGKSSADSEDGLASVVSASQKQELMPSAVKDELKMQELEKTPDMADKDKLSFFQALVKKFS